MHHKSKLSPRHFELLVSKAQMRSFFPSLTVSEFGPDMVRRDLLKSEASSFEGVSLAGQVL